MVLWTRAIMSYWWYPPTYYNHFLEHPILWSQDRRRWEEQRLAHECYSVWKAQERVKRSEKLRNQSEVWELRVETRTAQEIEARNEYILAITFLCWFITRHCHLHHRSVIKLFPSLINLSPSSTLHSRELEVLEAHISNRIPSHTAIHPDPWYFYCEIFPALFIQIFSTQIRFVTLTGRYRINKFLL